MPNGRVVSYGQVAAVCGKPRGAREVGRILNNLNISKIFLPGIPSESIPWWRVVNNQGVISIKGNWIADKQLQARLLSQEGVEVSKDLKLDIGKYRYAVNKR